MVYVLSVLTTNVVNPAILQHILLIYTRKGLRVVAKPFCPGTATYAATTGVAAASTTGASSKASALKKRIFPLSTTLSPRYHFPFE